MLINKALIEFHENIVHFKFYNMVALITRFFTWYVNFFETNLILIAIFFVLLIGLARTKVEMKWWDIYSLLIVLALWCLGKFLWLPYLA